MPLVFSPPLISSRDHLERLPLVLVRTITVGDRCHIATHRIARELNLVDHRDLDLGFTRLQRREIVRRQGAETPSKELTTPPLKVGNHLGNLKLLLRRRASHSSV